MNKINLLLIAILALGATRALGDAPLSTSGTELPAPPTDLTAVDTPWDGGHSVTLSWKLSPEDVLDEKGKSPIAGYRIYSGGEEIGLFTKVGGIVTPTPRQRADGIIVKEIDGRKEEHKYFFRVTAVVVSETTVKEEGEEPVVEKVETASPFVAFGPVTPTVAWFVGQRLWVGMIILVFCGLVIFYIQYARSGKKLSVRKIPALAAVDEAVGRATEMGRSCLFVPGIQDMNDIQTIAGLTVLSHVARTAAEYGSHVEVPTCRSLVMTTARETVEASFLRAGRPDAYNENLVYYVTDEQFGYVAHLTGKMAREKPAACFYMGSFYAESLILAETGNSVGAIQVAGTAQPSQLPFFVASCDYTLIGEEFFAASAYLSGEPEQLGSLKGQDMGKIFVGVIIIAGCILATVAAWTDETGTVGRTVHDLFDYLKDTMLK